MAKRIQRADLVDGIIDSTAIANYAVTVAKIKTLDTGDGTGINAETIPFQHGTATPTIASYIAGLSVSGTWHTDTWIGIAYTTQYNLSFNCDITKPHFLFVNGMQQTENAFNDYTIQVSPAQPAILLNYLPEVGLLIEFRYQSA